MVIFSNYFWCHQTVFNTWSPNSYISRRIPCPILNAAFWLKMEVYWPTGRFALHMWVIRIPALRQTISTLCAPDYEHAMCTRLWARYVRRLWARYVHQTMSTLCAPDYDHAMCARLWARYVRQTRSKLYAPDYEHAMCARLWACYVRQCSSFYMLRGCVSFAAKICRQHPKYLFLSLHSLSLFNKVPAECCSLAFFTHHLSVYTVEPASKKGRNTSQHPSHAFGAFFCVWGIFSPLYTCTVNI